ncbi:MAG: hypothetical protein U1F25_03025 [Rubrivivax sp.]
MPSLSEELVHVARRKVQRRGDGSNREFRVAQVLEHVPLHAPALEVGAAAALVARRGRGRQRRSRASASVRSSRPSIDGAGARGRRCRRGLVRQQQPQQVGQAARAVALCLDAAEHAAEPPRARFVEQGPRHVQQHLVEALRAFDDDAAHRRHDADVAGDEARLGAAALQAHDAFELHHHRDPVGAAGAAALGAVAAAGDVDQLQRPAGEARHACFHATASPSAARRRRRPAAAERMVHQTRGGQARGWRGAELLAHDCHANRCTMTSIAATIVVAIGASPAACTLKRIKAAASVRDRHAFGLSRIKPGCVGRASRSTIHFPPRRNLP